jgi:hypothetical protein
VVRRRFTMCEMVPKSVQMTFYDLEIGFLLGKTAPQFVQMAVLCVKTLCNGWQIAINPVKIVPFECQMASIFMKTEENSLKITMLQGKMLPGGSARRFYELRHLNKAAYICFFMNEFPFFI